MRESRDINSIPHANSITKYNIDLKNIRSVNYKVIKNDYKGDNACNGWIELTCKGADSCIDTEVEQNPFTPKKSTLKIESFMIIIPLNSSDEQARKIVKATKYLWRINGRQIEDLTFQKDLF